ncbi:hypothetical protein DS885_05415 [Psychromonas sp. B3M02]|nr:hypothetical protein DS885_05415 [Psychromonas sp. B3M02]
MTISDLERSEPILNAIAIRRSLILGALALACQYASHRIRLLASMNKANRQQLKQHSQHTKPKTSRLKPAPQGQNKHTKTLQAKACAPRSKPTHKNTAS